VLKQLIVFNSTYIFAVVPRIMKLVATGTD